MRYSEIKLVEQKIFESNRGIIGVVLDNQSGRGKSFKKPDGTDVNATNAWKFPLDPTILRYEPTEPNPDAAEDDIENLPIDQQFAAELKQETQLIPTNIKWAAGQKPGTGFSALVIELTSEKGREYVGKYFAKKDQAGHIFWQLTKFTQDMKPLGIDIQTKAAAGATGVDGAVVLGPREVVGRGDRHDDAGHQHGGRDAGDHADGKHDSGHASAHSNKVRGTQLAACL